MLTRSPALRMLCALPLLVLTACAGIDGPPDPRPEFTARNVDKTLLTYVDGLGTQVVHIATGGQVYLWSSARDGVQRGEWKYDILATGAATSYVGAGGINHPVQELETEWGLCFKYFDLDGRVVRRQNGGDWNCALLSDYEPLITERAAGDAFGLRTDAPRKALPEARRLAIADVAAL